MDSANDLICLTVRKRIVCRLILWLNRLRGHASRQEKRTGKRHQLDDFVSREVFFHLNARAI